jgi:hypothetical protein
MPSVCLVRIAEICAGRAPSGTVVMPSGPHPSWREISRTSHCVKDETVETLIFFPFRSFGLRSPGSFLTKSVRSAGGPMNAATPFTGAPRATKASSTPEPSPISIALAASACCSLALPAKLNS